LRVPRAGSGARVDDQPRQWRRTQLPGCARRQGWLHLTAIDGCPLGVIPAAGFGSQRSGGGHVNARRRSSEHDTIEVSRLCLGEQPTDDIASNRLWITLVGITPATATAGTHHKHVIRVRRDYTVTAPEEVTSGVFLFTVPPAPFLPQEAHGMPAAAVALVYTGSIEVGEEAIRPLREFGPPPADLVQPMPYSAAQSMADPCGHGGSRTTGNLAS